MSLLVWLPFTKDLTNQGLSDISITNNNAVINNNGKLGKCYSFDGDDTMTSNKTINITGDTSYTIMFWMYWSGDTWSTDYVGVAGFGAMSTANGAWGVIHNGYPDLDFWNQRYQSNTQLSVKTWYHIAFVKEAGTKCSGKIYINGEEVTGTASSTTVTPNITAGNLIIGRLNATASRYFKGYLNDVRIYDEALDAFEVKRISQGLILHYPLDDPYIESTTNLLSATTILEKTNHIWGGHCVNVSNYDCTNEPVPFNECSKLEVTYPYNDTTGGGVSEVVQSSISVESSTTYIYSAYLKASDNLAYWSANFLYYYSTGGGNKGVFNINNKEEIGDGWYRIWGIMNTTENQTSFQPYFYSYPAKTMTYWIGGWQLEKADHLTPYTIGNRDGDVIYDCSGYGNDGEVYRYDVNGDVKIDGDSPRYSVCTHVESKNTSTNTASGTMFLYGDCILNEPEKITVAFWCKPLGGYGGSSGQGQFSLTKNNQSSAGIDYLTSTMNQYDTGVSLNNVDGSLHIKPSVTFTANEWHHYAITYDNKTAIIYKDGVQHSTASFSSATNLASCVAVVIGFSRAGGVWRSNDSYYSDFRIYTTALSADDVLQLYNASAFMAKDGTAYAYELVEV